jgi:hypothetical protein
MEIWNKIIKNVMKQSTDLPTIPKTSRAPLWFHVSSDGESLFIDNAKDHSPSSSLSSMRKLTYKEFEKIYPIYLKREQGEAVSQEATVKTYNQVYWYSIIKHYSK